MDYKKSTTYFRNKFVPFEQANLSIASSPILYGLSIYTVFGAYWNDEANQLYAFRIPAHWQRLVNSAKIMDFHKFLEEWDEERFTKTMLELLKNNNVKEDALVRTTVFVDELAAGTKIHGLHNSLSSYVYPMSEILNKKGINMMVSSWRRLGDNVTPARAKVNGTYTNASLMKNEALLNGYDEAVALDEYGHVAESTVANIFIIREGKLITPGVTSDLLEGITRSSVFEIAESIGVDVDERQVDRSELYIADEVFVCGSSAQITPVLSIDKRLIGDGKVGPITSRLTQLHSKIYRGEEPQFMYWLTAVYNK